TLTGIADADPEGTYGGNGGDLFLGAGFVYNQGAINTSGASDDNGGDAGYMYISASFSSYNTGNLTATGGQGNAGDGGNGAHISIYSELNNYNSGALDGSGGGGTGEGGNAGYLRLQIQEDEHGDLFNSGDMTANGANGGYGGSGSSINLYGYGGAVINTGNLAATGGQGSVGYGGSGGNLDITTRLSHYYGSPSSDVRVDSGNIEISGNIDLSGGAGVIGGYAGELYIGLNAAEFPNGQEIILYGYTNINTMGGAGTTGEGYEEEPYAGFGGCIEISNFNSTKVSSDLDYVYGPAGGILNMADLNASGGNNTGGIGGGGRGGSVEITAGGWGGDILEWDRERVANYGAITTTGGGGATEGGHGGPIMLYGFDGAENHGAIIANGGEATADDYAVWDYNGTGGDAASGEEGEGVMIFSDTGPAVNTGSITAEGGDALGAVGEEVEGAWAGGGGWIEIIGNTADNSGNLSTAGGDANATDGYGGYGEDVFIYGIEGTVNTATIIDVSAGDGTTEKGDAGWESSGDHGLVFIGGFNVTDSWL
ncbi:MAG: hypothetical protein GY869_14420, partial [Planctomycetes bacterium]|nr:hypothetical protein [Planctomycetota bacterium]